MASFEDLRLKDLIERFEGAIEEINTTRNLSGLKEAGRKLQDVYDFFLTAESAYAEEQEKLKSLFSSFNYAAVIVNNAMKKGGLKEDDKELLGECFAIMFRCCDDLKKSLSSE